MYSKQITIKLNTLSKDPYLRKDEKYHSLINSTGWNIFESGKKLTSLRDILTEDYNVFEFEDGEEYKGIPTGQQYLDEDGDIIDFLPITLENHPNRLKFKITNNNILISSLRLAKSPALHFEKGDLHKYVFSNAFYIFTVSNEWNIKYLKYVLRTKKVKNVLDNNIYRGIGISAFKQEDILRVKIPFVSKTTQAQVVNRIKPYEEKIQKLKQKIISPQDLMNKVFSREFNFDIESLLTFEKVKVLYKSDSLSYRNEQLRSSYRWYKLKEIQQRMYENIHCIEKLGKYIKSTRNGWSPNCRETDTLYGVLGIDAIAKDTVINYDNLKFTDESRNNIDNCIVREGDFYVSRGNTVDLVALASIVHSVDEESQVIYPDLMIKIVFDDSFVDKQYMAYLFNSIIGRLYFKYSAKGKNQTMVKISSTELYNFYLPLPKLHKQKNIVDEIKNEISEQEEIRKKIGIHRNAIDSIIEKSLLDE